MNSKLSGNNLRSAEDIKAFVAQVIHYDLSYQKNALLDGKAAAIWRYPKIGGGSTIAGPVANIASYATLLIEQSGLSNALRRAEYWHSIFQSG